MVPLDEIGDASPRARLAQEAGADLRVTGADTQRAAGQDAAQAFRDEPDEDALDDAVAADALARVVQQGRRDELGGRAGVVAEEVAGHADGVLAVARVHSEVHAALAGGEAGGGPGVVGAGLTGVEAAREPERASEEEARQGGPGGSGHEEGRPARGAASP